MPRPSADRITTTAEPERLLDVDVVVFDFDGTLYEGTGFLEPHLAALQGALGPDGPDLSAAYEQVLAGEHVLQLGDLFDFDTATIIRPIPEPPDDVFGLRVDATLDLEGRRVPPPASVVDGHVAFGAPVTYVGDPWQISAALARGFGVDPAARREAFVAVRHVMNGDDYDLGIPACLDDLLARFAHVGQRILVTNTDEELGALAVARLDVDDHFDRMVFGANKPVGLAGLLGSIVADVDPARVLCVGDNYWNDVLPAYQLGTQSVLIDPFDIAAVSDRPLHLHELTDLERILAGQTTSPMIEAGSNR
jgi:FMN phosphatase YigB (HAD superfamily)